MHAANFSEVQAKDWKLQIRVLFKTKLGQSPSALYAWHPHPALFFNITGALCRPHQLCARNYACRQLFGCACRRLDAPGPSSLHDKTRSVPIGTIILHCSYSKRCLVCISSVTETIYAANLLDVQAKDWTLQVHLLFMTKLRQSDPIGNTILHCSYIKRCVVLISAIPCTASSHKTTSE